MKSTHSTSLSRRILASWPTSGSSPPNGRTQGGPEPKQRTCEDHEVTDLEQVRSLAHYHMDGVNRPTMQSESRRHLFIEEVEKVSNEQFQTWEDGDGIKVSPELESFIKFADAVVDLDFRYSGICEFTLVPSEVGSEDLDDQTARNWVQSSLSPSLLAGDALDALASIGLKVRGGFGTGIATREEDWMWYSAYVYCRWEEDEEDEEEEQGHKDSNWARRIVFWNDAQFLEVEGDFVFDSIVEFLDWYCSWPETLDLDRMREIMYGHDDEPSIFGGYLTE